MRRKIPSFYLQSVDSTQTEVERLLGSGLRPPFFVYADHQTQGRGRLNRDWISSPGASLLMSFALLVDSEGLRGLSLLVGYSVVKILGSDQLLLKWPNDIMYEDSKVGGILIQSRSRELQAEVIVGLGLNLRDIEGSPYRALPDSVAALEPEDFASRLIGQIETNLEQGFSALKPSIEELLWRRGKWIQLALSDGQIEGELNGLDQHGRIVLSRGQIVHVSADGEIQLVS